MDMPQELIDLGLRLTETATRNTASAIASRIGAAKASGRKDEAIAALEDIVSELVADKQELTRVAQAYQSELVAQRLSSGDVRYIADTLLPLLEQLATATPNGQQLAQQLDAFKPVLSAETANILQLLGFNFRKAIGEPLTNLTANAIESRVNRSEELQLETLKREQLYIQLALDPEAHARFTSMFRK
ncbi:hypothetical protein AB0O16_07365 [Microbacterium sp. NPDC089180]|uniref:hypothetical protein n=1 Tax=unclassified Microbacterium TaxID=2609290 RepID=UPI00341E7566